MERIFPGVAPIRTWLRPLCISFASHRKYHLTALGWPGFNYPWVWLYSHGRFREGTFQSPSGLGERSFTTNLHELNLHEFKGVPPWR